MVNEIQRIKNKKNLKILVFRALKVGDLLCTVPAFRALRLAFSTANISLIGLPLAKSFTERFNNYFNRFIEFSGFPGLPELPFDPLKTLNFIRNIQKEKFDLVFQMHGDGTVANLLVELLGVKVSVGFYSPGSYLPNKDTYLMYPWNKNEIEKHISLMEFLGFGPIDKTLEFPILSKDYEDLKKTKEIKDLGLQKYICVHAGASSSDKQWSVDKFAFVADNISDLGFQVVFTGVKEEVFIADQISKLMRNKSINLVGKTTLGGVGVLLKHSSLLISNDTGVSHIADALKVPSIIVYLSSDSTRWAPLDKKIHKIINFEKAQNPKNVTFEAKFLLKKLEVKTLRQINL